MTSNTRLILFSAISVLLLASVPVVIKAIQANPWTIAFSRLVIGAFFAGLYVAYKKEHQTLTRQSLAVLGLMGVCFALHWITYFYSIKLSTPATAMVALSFYGPSLLIWSRFLLGTRIHRGDYLALGLALVGSFICMPSFSLQNHQTLGFLLGLASGMIYALLPILQQKARAYPVMLKAFGQFSFALLAFLPFYGYTDWQLSTTDWLGLAFLGIAGTLIAHSLWVNVTTQCAPIVITLLSYAQIPIAVLLSSLFLAETPKPSLLIGALFILAANVVTIINKKR
jgi:drug/metabolite transporter (DMT)-like permease